LQLLPCFDRGKPVRRASDSEGRMFFHGFIRQNLAPALRGGCID